ncbi:MAG: PTS sugar transporter subunit IIA [Succinivibrio sp.]|nr:PTS sugar transporter subunit IIA [Succinivibrio sp.]
MQIGDLLKPVAIDLNYAPKDKADAINHLVDLMEKSGNLNDADRYRKAVFEREAKVSTGLGEGVAIPHAKSAGVTAPGLAAMVASNGIDFDSLDGKTTYLFFLIASPHNASNEHLDVLARLSTLLIDENFRTSLIHAKNKEKFLKSIELAEKQKIKEENQDTCPSQEAVTDTAQSSSEEQDTDIHFDLVAVTACPAGLSHTYMAAESLEKAALSMGIKIKVEADGAAGHRNKLLPEDIAYAKGVVVAADRAVEMDRFIGKPLVQVGVVEGIRRPKELIEQALSSNCPTFDASTKTEYSSMFMRLYRHLMSGLTYLLPLAATAGILSAIARIGILHNTNLGLFLDSIGYSIGTLLFPVLSAFIAFSIAGKTALVAGFTGGVMAMIESSGVLGAVANGFVGGGVAFCTASLAQRFLKGHDAMFALLVYPIVGALGTTLIAQFVTNLPFALLDDFLNSLFANSGLVIQILLGSVLAGMMSADMGGPMNKISYACGALLLADCLPENGPGSLVMASVMAGGMIPPMAAGAAAGLLGRRFFDEHERKIAFWSFLKGLLFITEGVVPFLAFNRQRMTIACIVGSATAGGLSMYYQCQVCAPHGGIFIIPLAENSLSFLFSLFIGTLVGAVLFTVLRIGVKRQSDEV